MAEIIALKILCQLFAGQRILRATQITFVYANDEKGRRDGVGRMKLRNVRAQKRPKPSCSRVRVSLRGLNQYLESGFDPFREEMHRSSRRGVPERCVCTTTQTYII